MTDDVLDDVAEVSPLEYLRTNAELEARLSKVYGKVDDLQFKIAALHANLHVISYGEGFEFFDGCNTGVKSSLLYGCAQLANECIAILDES
jgi:hypothetical protein